jgi:hypothetical protein
MTSTIGNHLLSLLKRNETLWPNPEASTGIFYRQMGRSCCWEAVGPAREVFIQIADEIKSHLEKSSDPVSHTVTWTIYMIGRTRERAKPTIMFCCQVPGPRKRVRKMIEESDILSKYPGIVTGDSTRPPDFDQLVQLTKSERIEYLGLSKAKMRKFIFYEPSKDVCGVHIHVKYSDYPDVLPRKATIGGILRAGDKYLCLTVAHAFTDKDQFQSSEATNNSNFEYDVDGQSDTDEDDVDMVDTTSRGSRTPEYAESPESQVTTMSMDSSTVASSQIQQPQSPSNITELALETSAAKRAEVLLSEEHNRVARRNMQIDLKEIWDASVLTSTNGPRPGLDYALIETTLPDFQTFNQFHSTKLSSQHLPYPERIAFTRPEPDTEVFAATASKGAVEGTISGTPTFMQTPSSNSIQELWTVRLFGSLENGDCGSWVVSRESGDVYGHIVAGSPESGVAYVVPAHQVYADVKARFNLDLRLSARDLEADNRESNGLTLSEVPSVERNKLQMMESDQNNATFPPLLSSSRLDFDLMPPGDENQSQYHGPPMDRNTISSSSTESSWSTGFSQGQGDVASALSSYSNPSSDGGLSRRGYQYEQPQNGYLSPEPAEPPRKSSIGLPLFNIERDGDPRIEWTMYYDFMVTKAEAYYQLQPSYLPTKKYPSRIKSEKVLM